LSESIEIYLVLDVNLFITLNSYLNIFYGVCGVRKLGMFARLLDKVVFLNWKDDVVSEIGAGVDLDWTLVLGPHILNIGPI
jgi:hypothetical protein